MTVQRERVSFADDDPERCAARDRAVGAVALTTTSIRKPTPAAPSVYVWWVAALTRRQERSLRRFHEKAYLVGEAVWLSESPGDLGVARRRFWACLPVGVGEPVG